jgi:hypothetical protein
VSHFPDQALHLSDGEHFFVHHADEELFHRSRTESLDDLPDGAGGDAARRTAACKSFVEAPVSSRLALPFFLHRALGL